MSTKTNYIGYKLITNIKKGDLLGYFLSSKISDLAYSIETLIKDKGLSSVIGYISYVKRTLHDLAAIYIFYVKRRWWAPETLKIWCGQSQKFAYNLESNE